MPEQKRRWLAYVKPCKKILRVQPLPMQTGYSSTSWGAQSFFRSSTPVLGALILLLIPFFSLFLLARSLLYDCFINLKRYATLHYSSNLRVSFMIPTRLTLQSALYSPSPTRRCCCCCSKLPSQAPLITTFRRHRGYSRPMH